MLPSHKVACLYKTCSSYYMYVLVCNKYATTSVYQFLSDAFMYTGACETMLLEQPPLITLQVSNGIDHIIQSDVLCDWTLKTVAMDRSVRFVFKFQQPPFLV